MVVNGTNAVPFNQAQATVPVRTSIIVKYRNGLPGYPYFDVVAATYPHTHFRPWVPQYPKFVPSVAGQLTAKQALDQAATETNKVLSK
jgi:hypothetical protein